MKIKEIRTRAVRWRGKTIPLEQVRDTHGAAGNLVFVGRADAPACGTDRVRSPGNLTSLVELNVRREDQRAVR